MEPIFHITLTFIPLALFRYQELLEKHKKLESEYEDCKSRLQIELQKQDIEDISQVEMIISDQSNDSGHVIISSSPRDKIDLFLTLFKGRSDVHAKRWKNNKGGHGYSPANCR